MQLEGLVAVVTGGTRGIGRAIAEAFIREGAQVVVCSRGAADAEQAAAEIGALGASCDVTRQADVERLLAHALDAFGHVDILVNNAGTTVVKPTIDLLEEDWSHVLATNLTGPFLCSQAFGRHMLSRGHGSIVNITSISAELGFPGRAPYCASKGGLWQLTQALAVEWAEAGVRVNALEPGYIRTPWVDGLVEQGILAIDRLERRIPMRELGQLTDVAQAAVFLASPAARYITGASLRVDGGWVAYGGA